MRPKKLNEMAGQAKIIELMQTLVRAAQIKKEPLPHCLFCGFSGAGKTTIAEALANELNVPFIQFNGCSITSSNDLRLITSCPMDNAIFFIDEIHLLPNKVQTWLYTVLEDLKVLENGKVHKVKPFTLVGATTDRGNLNTPFKNRFQVVVTFDPYSQDEIVEIIKKVCSGKFTISDDIAQLIAGTCRGTPRLAVNRVELIYNYMIGNALRKLSKKEILEILSLQGIDEQGLTDLDRRYLKELESGPIGLESLAKKLNTKPETLLEDVEPYLLASNLIKVTKHGRQLAGNEWGFAEFLKNAVDELEVE